MGLQLLDCLACIRLSSLSSFARELILIVVNSGKPCGDSHAAVAMVTNPRFQLLLEPSFLTVLR